MARRQGLWDMRGKLIKFSAYIPGSLYDRLRDRAKREKKTISFLLAEILEKELNLEAGAKPCQGGKEDKPCANL